MITDTRERIIEFITKNKQARVHDLVLNLKVGNVAIHRQLNKLISIRILRKIGKPPLVLYVLNDEIPLEVSLEGIKQKAIPILKKEGVILLKDQFKII